MKYAWFVIVALTSFGWGTMAERWLHEKASAASIPPPLPVCSPLAATTPGELQHKLGIPHYVVKADGTVGDINQFWK